MISHSHTGGVTISTCLLGDTIQSIILTKHGQMVSSQNLPLTLDLEDYIALTLL